MSELHLQEKFLIPFFQEGLGYQEVKVITNSLKHMHKSVMRGWQGMDNFPLGRVTSNSVTGVKGWSGDSNHHPYFAARGVYYSGPWAESKCRATG
jgi:hypothetical protein